MRRLSMVMVCVVLVVSIVVNSVLVLAQEPIYYYKDVFKVSGTEFYINITYIFENTDPRVEENNTITYLIRPYNSTHLNVTTITVYYLYYFYYKPQVKRIESSSWRFMKYSLNGYIVLEYNGSAIPTFNVSSYTSACNLLDNYVSRILSAQFSASNMIDVRVEYSGSVRRVDVMSCLKNGNGVVAIMGGRSEELDLFYFALAYLPILVLLAFTMYHFVKKKLLVRKVFQE